MTLDKPHGGTLITFEYSSRKYYVDDEAFYLDYIILPDGTLLKVSWNEESNLPEMLKLTQVSIPENLMDVTLSELAFEYHAIIAFTHE